ncbi:MAG: GNAT family N-acetyltransferase [Ktedonobacteraceae bacterium]|nr:GNAT family N-acetyltransferase [Ktedonobacteraceae bacterium]
MAYIEVRAAQAQDRPVILAFCEHTWEWGDYIERAWDGWFSDANGKLLVATAGGIPAGVVHLQMLTDNDAWIEGLRVDPAHRQQGIGRALNEAAMIEAMNRGAPYIRLTTEATNTASIQLARSLHMRQVGAFALYTASPILSPPRRALQETIQVATLDDLDTIIDYLNVSNIFPLTGGLYYVKFTAYPITAELLEQKIAQQSIYLLRRWDRLDGLAIAELREEQQEQRLSVGYIDGTTIEAVSLIAYDLRKRAAVLELERVRAYAPDLVLVHDAFNGIEYETKGSIFCSYERGLV